MHTSRRGWLHHCGCRGRYPEIINSSNENSSNVSHKTIQKDDQKVITVRHRNTYKSLCFSLLFFLRKTRGIGDLASYQSSPSSGSSPQPPSTIARSSIRSAIPSSPSPVSPGGTLRQPSYFQSTPKGWHPVTPPATSPISQQSIQPNWYNQQQQQNQQFQVSNRNIDVDLRQTDIYRYIYIYRYVLYNNNWNKYERTKCGIKFSFI